MGEQLDIFRGDDPMPGKRKRASRSDRPSIEKRWADFHATNPHVMNALLRLARARLARGDTRIGVKALWEELRSELAVSRTDEVFKLNNDFTALYARKLIELDGSLATVIEVRQRKARSK